MQARIAETLTSELLFQACVSGTRVPDFNRSVQEFKYPWVKENRYCIHFHMRAVDMIPWHPVFDMQVWIIQEPCTRRSRYRYLKLEALQSTLQLRDMVGRKLSI